MLYRTTLENQPAFADNHKEIIMGKAKETSKEAKKQAAKTPKEKKAAKQAKKHASDSIPLTIR
jgi:hypothetical protein